MQSTVYYPFYLNISRLNLCPNPFPMFIGYQFVGQEQMSSKLLSTTCTTAKDKNIGTICCVCLGNRTGNPSTRQLTRQIVVAKTSHSCCCCRCFSCCLSSANRFDYNNESNLLTLHLSRLNISLAFISAFLLFHCVAYF